MLNFEKHREQALIHMLEDLETRDAVLGYEQIKGLLYAIACSPEPIRPSEWFELIWLDDEPPFEDIDEGKSFFNLLVELSRHISDAAQKALHRPGVNRFGELSPAALVAWCEGFLIGHHYLDNLWTIALNDLDDDELFEQVEAAVHWAHVVADGDVIDPTDEVLDDRLLTTQLQFEEWLRSYQSVRERWYLRGYRWDVNHYFEEMQPVAADALCPCGSGRPFRNCCLH